jgi:hypothetical protein
VTHDHFIARSHRGVTLVRLPHYSQAYRDSPAAWRRVCRALQSFARSARYPAQLFDGHLGSASRAMTEKRRGR